MSRLFVGQRCVGTGELQQARTPPLLFGVSPLARSPMNGISRRVESYMVDRFTGIERLLFPLPWRGDHRVVELRYELISFGPGLSEVIAKHRQAAL